MKINGINHQKCIMCQECIRDCPPGLYTLENQPGQKIIIFADPGQRCIRCGHCIAICPADAIVYAAEQQAVPYTACTDASRDLSVMDLQQFLARRRSVRRFKQTAVSQVDLNALFTAMQHAPSASNARKWQFLVVRDQATIKYLSTETVQLFRIFRNLSRWHWLIKPLLPAVLKKLLGNPAVRESLEQALADHAGGKDIILFHAPCLIILHSPAYAHLGGNDAGIILTHGMLAAESLGLGSCWIGFLQEAFRMKKKLKSRLGIPANHHVEGVLVLGYPAMSYHQIPPRKELEVRYLG